MKPEPYGISEVDIMERLRLAREAAPYASQEEIDRLYFPIRSENRVKPCRTS